MAAFAYFVTCRLMGRDYDAAVTAGAHCGSGLGATPNAAANLESIVERYGAAPGAILVAPTVGVMDLTNSLTITGYRLLVH
ncbi:MAG: sodium/glutamate symporter [Vicinamibacterales bacterium]